MKNSNTQLGAAMLKAKAQFAAMVEARVQTQRTHAAAVASKANTQPQPSIHWRTR